MLCSNPSLGKELLTGGFTNIATMEGPRRLIAKLCTTSSVRRHELSALSCFCVPDRIPLVGLTLTICPLSPQLARAQASNAEVANELSRGQDRSLRLLASRSSIKRYPGDLDMKKENTQKLQRAMMFLRHSVDELFNNTLRDKKGDDLPLDVDNTIYELTQVKLFLEEVILILLLPDSLEAIQEVGIHGQGVGLVKRRSMMRIMARRMNAATVVA
jgi:hypothetical protein